MDNPNNAYGGFSNTSKMPCPSYGIPAQNCRIGGLLVDVFGSICFECYALDNGRYAMPNVKNAQERRYKKLLKALDNPKVARQWVREFADCIKSDSPDYYRWFDSGDLVNTRNLQLILRVCRLTPDCEHWLPTKEKNLAKSMKERFKPKNLTLRVSSAMVNGNPPIVPSWLNTSTVHMEGQFNKKTQKFACPVTKEKNTCDSWDCRRCWDENVDNTSYKKIKIKRRKK